MSNHQEINKAFAEHKCKPELPLIFTEIYKKQYNLWQEKKKAKPRLSQEQLYSSSDALFDVLPSMNAMNLQSNAKNSQIVYIPMQTT